MALQMLKVKPMKDTADMMMEATIAASHFMKIQRRGQELRMAEALSITSLFNPQTLIALRDIDEQELREMKKLYLQYKPLMEITDKARVGWINFTLQVKAAGAQIVSVIAEELAKPDSPFVQSVTKLSQSIAHFFKIIMDSPVTEKLLKKLGKYIEEFSKWLDRPETISTIEKFLMNVKDIVKSMIEAIGLLKQIMDDWTGAEPTRAPRGRRALARRIGIERPAEAPKISPPLIERHPGRAKFFKKIGITRPSGAPPAARPQAAPIAKYPGRARFHEKIGIERAPTAPRIAPRVTEPSRMGAPKPGGPAPDKIGVTKGGVNESDLYNTYVQYFKNSKLNGYVPKDGARWGIVNGTPEEYARLAVATSKQESS
jgi:hypothetical protein